MMTRGRPPPIDNCACFDLLLLSQQHLQVQYKHPGAGTCGWLQWTQELLHVLLQVLSQWGWGVSTDWLQLRLCLHLEGVWRG